MATTFVDSYTFIDSVNAQDPAATQYNSNEGDGTLTTKLYTPSSAPVIEAALRDLNPGAILSDGYSQKALYELLLMIQVNWDNAMAALDDDGGVGTTTYEAGCAIGSIDGDYDDSFATAAIGVELGVGQNKKINISPSGIGTRELAIFCQAIATQIAACTALLDADATLGDTDYAITTAASLGVRGKTDIKFSELTASIPGNFGDFSIVHPDAVGVNPLSKIKTTGIGQEALIDFLNTVVTNMNALWVKLDADI